MIKATRIALVLGYSAMALGAVLIVLALGLGYEPTQHELIKILGLFTVAAGVVVGPVVRRQRRQR